MRVMLLRLNLLAVAGTIASRATASPGALVLTMSVVIAALLATIGRLTHASLIVRPGRRRRQRRRPAS